VEGKSRKSPKDWMGRTTSGKVVVFSDPQEKYKMGDLLKVKIIQSTKATLMGEVID
jgi:tRNA-2-methylthio-N6-dimethylallyladenosine synthase